MRDREREGERDEESASISAPKPPGGVQTSVNSARVLPFVTRDGAEGRRRLGGGREGPGRDKGGQTSTFVPLPFVD